MNRMYMDLVILLISYFSSHCVTYVKYHCVKDFSRSIIGNLMSWLSNTFEKGSLVMQTSLVLEICFEKKCKEIHCVHPVVLYVVGQRG